MSTFSPPRSRRDTWQHQEESQLLYPIIHLLSLSLSFHRLLFTYVKKSFRRNYYLDYKRGTPSFDQVALACHLLFATIYKFFSLSHFHSRTNSRMAFLLSLSLSSLLSRDREWTWVQEARCWWRGMSERETVLFHFVKFAAADRSFVSEGIEKRTSSSYNTTCANLDSKSAYLWWWKFSFHISSKQVFGISARCSSQLHLLHPAADALISLFSSFFSLSSTHSSFLFRGGKKWCRCSLFIPD